jgi:hypothetical protein
MKDLVLDLALIAEQNMGLGKYRKSLKQFEKILGMKTSL